MSQAYNLGKFANTLNTSGQIDVTTGITGTFPTTNLPTIPINKGGTNLTTVGANGTILSTDGSAYIYGSASGAITWDTVKTSSFTASAGFGYLVNTTSSTITVTLPASPSIGQSVVVVDYAGTSATNNITVAPNGSPINKSVANIVISTNRTGLTFVYIDATQGWLAQSNVYSGSPPFAQPIVATYLVLAGGGGSGTQYGGGGGGGGILLGSAILTLGQSYTITVGGGGSAGSNGSNSVLSGSGITTQTAIGGGKGGAYNGVVPSSGGSGGGAGSSESGSQTAGGSGTFGQGSSGGAGGGRPGLDYGGCGGGGGGGATGSNGVLVQSGAGGNGGIGIANTITGSSVYYAGGGGGSGGYPSGLGSTGGTGGGGNGSNGAGVGGTAGTANLGGGGGGVFLASGTSGGSGVIILAIPTGQYSGTSTGSPTVTTSGSNTILKFTASGTYTA
jgi:hypothetical protein